MLSESAGLIIDCLFGLVLSWVFVRLLYCQIAFSKYFAVIVGPKLMKVFEELVLESAMHQALSAPRDIDVVFVVDQVSNGIGYVYDAFLQNSYDAHLPSASVRLTK